jgi:hypothetical protein
MNRAELRKVEQEMDDALSAIAKRYGLDVGAFKVRIEGDGMDVFARLTVPGAAEAEWNMGRKYVEMGQVAFGATFKAGAHKYTIAGLKLTSKAYPVLGARVPDGKVFKFRAETVRAGL